MKVPALVILSLVSIGVASSGCSVDAESDSDITASAVGATPSTLEECVAEHVRRAGGRPLAVTKVNCAVPVSDCSIPSADASVLAPLANVRSLDLTGRCLTDPRPIGRLVKLERLELRGNRIEDLRPLGTLTRLVSLGLAENQNVQDTWGVASRAPFESFSKLEELDLDGTWIQNAMPISVLTNLRRVSLRRTFLFTVRPLLPLTKLRELHIDEAGVEDLAPLADMRELTELTLDGNSVVDLEPLRALAGGGKRGGKLRRVSLRGNCAASCDAVAGITHDCADQRATCDHPAQSAMPAARSVPVAALDRFTPKSFPVWSQADLTRAFELARTSPEIDWKDARSGCDGRASKTADLLKAAGFTGFTKVLAYGNLRALSKNDVAGYVTFDWHIAVTARAALPGGREGYFVLDPALDDARPLPLTDWFARQVDSRGSALDFSCVRYNASKPDPEARCRNVGNVDAKGNYLVDELRQLRGTVCGPDEVCIPGH